MAFLEDLLKGCLAINYRTVENGKWGEVLGCRFLILKLSLEQALQSAIILVP